MNEHRKREPRVKAVALTGELDWIDRIIPRLRGQLDSGVGFVILATKTGLHLVAHETLNNDRFVWWTSTDGLVVGAFLHVLRRLCRPADNVGGDVATFFSILHGRLQQIDVFEDPSA